MAREGDSGNSLLLAGGVNQCSLMIKIYLVPVYEQLRYELMSIFVYLISCNGIGLKSPGLG